MSLRKFRWSTTYESAEEELTSQLARKNISATRWAADPFEAFETHSHDTGIRLWCAEGSLMITVGEQDISLQPGDTLDIPAGMAHSAIAGLNGCGCYEANTPAA